MLRALFFQNNEELEGGHNYPLLFLCQPYHLKQTDKSSIID